LDFTITKYLNFIHKGVTNQKIVDGMDKNPKTLSGRLLNP